MGTAEMLCNKKEECKALSGTEAAHQLIRHKKALAHKGLCFLPVLRS